MEVASPGEGDTIVKVKRLDDYLTDRRISPDEIEYIWMDAEGYESKIVAAAIKTLLTKKIPLLAEFNLHAYSRQNILEMYYGNIQKTYSHFIYFAGRSRIAD